MTFRPCAGWLVPVIRYQVRRTRLLGRGSELATLAPLLMSERLATLVGPGAIGKTLRCVSASICVERSALTRSNSVRAGSSV